MICGECSVEIQQWRQCSTHKLDIGYCKDHGGAERAEREMRAHIAAHIEAPQPRASREELVEMIRRLHEELTIATKIVAAITDQTAFAPRRSVESWTKATDDAQALLDRAH